MQSCWDAWQIAVSAARQMRLQHEAASAAQQLSDMQQTCRQHEVALRSAKSAVKHWQERCRAVEAQHVRRVLGRGAGTLLGAQLSAHAVHTALPPRCSHQAVALTVQGHSVHVILGGLADNAWQASAFVVCNVDSMLPGEAHGEIEPAPPSVHQAHTSDTQALSCREAASCIVSADSFVLSGSTTRNGTGMEVWRAWLHLADGVF